MTKTEIKVGDRVTRWLAGTIPVELVVSGVTDDRIVCGSWEFDKLTGAEIDEELGWGPPPKYGVTGSFIKMPGVQYKEATDEEAWASFNSACNKEE
jgi:hypothetical protein